MEGFTLFEIGLPILRCFDDTKEKKVGARALRAILEEFMLDIMYEIPKDDNIGRITITREYVEGTGGEIIDIRSGSAANPDGLRVISAES